MATAAVQSSSTAQTSPAAQHSPTAQYPDIPKIEIEPPTSPAYTESTQASVNPNFLYVVPLAAGNLVELRNTTNETMKLRVETCRLNAVAAHKEALAANVQLKKKTFIIKLAIAVVASLIFLGSLAGTVASEGAAIPVTAGFGVIALLAISDACCAYKDWQMSEAGREGLPMGANGLGNGLHLLLKLFPMQEEKRQTVAKWSSLIVKTILTLGILGVTDFSVNVSMDNSSISTPLMPLTGIMSKLAVTHIAKNKATEEEVSCLNAKSQLTGQLEEQMEDAQSEMSKLLGTDAEQEADLRKASAKELKKLREKDHKLKIQLEQQKALQQQCLTFVDMVPEEYFEQVDVTRIYKTLNTTPQPVSPRRRSCSGDFASTQVNLGKVRAAPAATAMTAQEHLEQAKQSAEEFKTASIRHARNTFISKIIRSICLGCSLSPISLIISIGDAKHAYKDWQLKKQGKPGLTFGPDWIANKMYQRMIRNGRSEEAAKKRANRVSMGVRLVFSFGALISAGDQHCVVEKFTNSVCSVETLMSPALDEAEDDGEADEARSEVELQKRTADLEQELLHRQQIASSAHNVAMNMATHGWKNDQHRIQARINKNKAKLAELQKVIEDFKSQMHDMVADHRPELEGLLNGGVKELFREVPPPRTHYHHYETTV